MSRPASGAPVTLTKYLELRLGRTPREQAANVLGRPFGADSVAGFWRYWNPLWGYYLSYYCYQPLRTLAPRPFAAWLTFVVCGVVHDLPFVAGAAIGGSRPASFTLTAFFALTGGLVVLTERLRIRFTRLPVVARWLVHSGALAGCYEAALLLTASRG